MSNGAEEKRPKRAKRGDKRALSVWLLEEDIAELKAIAREKGIGHTTLVRMWVREKLKEQGGHTPRGQ